MKMLGNNWPYFETGVLNLESVEFWESSINWNICSINFFLLAYIKCIKDD